MRISGHASKIDNQWKWKQIPWSVNEKINKLRWIRKTLKKKHLKFHASKTTVSEMVKIIVKKKRNLKDGKKKDGKNLPYRLWYICKYY